jgi:predicted GTPase
MSSHAEFLSQISGFSEIGIREILNISTTHRKRYSTLVQNYRKALETKNNVSARRKGIEKHGT